MHHVWTGSGLFQERGNFVLHPKAQWDNTDLVLHALCPVLWDYKCKLPHMQTHFQSTHSGLTSPFTPAFLGVSLSALTFPLSFLHPQGGNNLPSKSFPLSRCHSNQQAGRHDNPYHGPEIDDRPETGRENAHGRFAPPPRFNLLCLILIQNLVVFFSLRVRFSQLQSPFQLHRYLQTENTLGA